MRVRVLLAVEDDVGPELAHAEGPLAALLAGGGRAGAVGALGLVARERLLLAAALPLADAAAAEAPQGLEGAVEEDALDTAGGGGLGLAAFLGLGRRLPRL